MVRKGGRWGDCFVIEIVTVCDGENFRQLNTVEPTRKASLRSEVRVPDKEAGEEC